MCTFLGNHYNLSYVGDEDDANDGGGGDVHLFGWSLQSYVGDAEDDEDDGDSGDAMWCDVKF